MSQRILLVNTFHFYGGGDSTYTFNLAELLRSQGHKVAFFAMQDERNLSDPNSDLFVSNIDFRNMNKQRGIVNGARVLKRVIYSREARQKFSQIINRFSPDVIHLQNIMGHISPSIILETRKRKIPVVWTLHDYKLICPNTHFLIDTTGEICEACSGGRYYQPVLKRCKKGSLLASSMASLEAYAHRFMKVREQIDAFITPSRFLRARLITEGFNPTQVHYLPHFLSENLFQASSKNGNYMLFLGRLTSIKGIYTLLEASQMVPDIRILLAGRIEEQLKSTMTEIMPDNVEYMGIVHGEELRHLLVNSTALVMPSLWYENQPFSILEAFACEKPVIASDLGGMKELVVHLERGILVPPGDASALAEAMLSIAESPQEVSRMGANAREYAVAHHHPNVHYHRLMDIYAQVV